ncbi:UNKNOWN [Stylonychia lemnae]|uniref:Transmembrane protein n=1 Tax=Stylonychia lemnae TaxID=5949 RepID=A0A078AXJ0_STYLE|nr:UNKNOWN [Stylonychia lemnae]|eukprot:CDW87180.1 UNKNOWN [Stylonychia lemnae]
MILISIFVLLQLDKVNADDIILNQQFSNVFKEIFENQARTKVQEQLNFTNKQDLIGKNYLDSQEIVITILFKSQQVQSQGISYSNKESCDIQTQYQEFFPQKTQKIKLDMKTEEMGFDVDVNDELIVVSMTLLSVTQYDANYPKFKEFNFTLSQTMAFGVIMIDQSAQTKWFKVGIEQNYQRTKTGIIFSLNMVTAIVNTIYDELRVIEMDKITGNEIRDFKIGF